MGMVKKAILGGILALAIGLPALALDVNDVKNLVQNGVQEQVIISMLQARGLTSQPTTQDIVDLSAMGASSTLLSYLTPCGSAANPCPPTTTVVTPAPTTTIVTPAPTTTYVVPQPEVVVAPPPTVYYYPGTYTYPRYYNGGSSFSFYFGSGPRYWGPGPYWGPRPYYWGPGPRWGPPGPGPRWGGGPGRPPPPPGGGRPPGPPRRW